MDGAVLQRVLIDQAIEVLFQRTRDCGRSTGARAIYQSLGPLVGKAMHPFPQGRIRKLERVGDVWDAPAFDDGADSLGTAEDARFCGLFQESVYCGEGIIGKGQFEGAHAGGLPNKVRQQGNHPTSHHVLTRLAAESLSDSNFPEAACSVV